MSNRPALLITSNHIMTPLWESLSEHYDLCIVGQQAGLAVDLEIKGAVPIQKYATADANETAINAAYKLSAKLFDNHTSASLGQEIEKWVGDDCPPQLRADPIRQWWPAMVGEHVRQQVGLIELLKNTMREHKIVGCLVHEDVMPDMRAMVLFCKTRGIPTIHVPHANCFYTGEQWDIHTESICDYIAASGAYAKDFYMRWGYDGEHIQLVGAPQLDSWYSNHAPTKEEARKVLGIGENDFVIIYASSWGQLTSARGGFESEFAGSFERVLDAASKLKATLVVKMHPGEARGQEDGYLSGLKQAGINGCVTRTYNEYVLRAGNVLIAHGPSNICVQAAIVNLPSCYFPTEGFDFPVIGGPIWIDVALLNTMEYIQGLGKSYWDAFAKQMNDVHDCFSNGSACDRAIEFVRRICHD